MMNMKESMTVAALAALTGMICPKLSASDADHVLYFDSPASKWENGGLPIGNGSLGGVVMGDVDRAVMQFNVDSLWTGNENKAGKYNKTGKGDVFGAYQNFGFLIFEQGRSAKAGVKLSSPRAAEGFRKAVDSSSSETVAQSVDGNLGSKWCVIHHGSKMAWQVDLGEKTALDAYSFTSANDVPSRDPAHWMFEGSDDGKTWKMLDKKVDVAPMPKRGLKVGFKLDRPVKYRHYRFVFAPRKGVEHFQVAEISLDGVSLSAQPSVPAGYRRQLDIARAVHTTSWQSGGVNFQREAIASQPGQVIVWRISADQPGQIGGLVKLEGAHKGMETVSVTGSGLKLRGQLPNQLQYEARVQVRAKGGVVKKGADGVEVRGADEVLLFLAADTNYVMDRAKGWMQGDPADRVAPRLKASAGKEWPALLAEHEQDYTSFYHRASLDLGKSDAALASKPINQRIQRYRDQAKALPRPCLDPELEAMLFNYGRYLLISSSREGTLPANLQGIWCNSNAPAWCSDFHSNINLQMNYWLAETTNLPELSRPLFDLLTSGVPVYREHTALHYGGDTQGFVTRMSINPFGGTGWNWNIEGTAWLSQHYWEHYQFSKDESFLEKSAWPWMRGVSLFWLPRLKELPDGSLVVPNAWSHEHGPHEDGTAHAQQLMWDLFSSTLKAAEVLDRDPELQKRLKTALGKLYGPKIGSWGQLMEWMGEKDLEKGNHRHTSHLFAVHPGSQITLAQQPKLAEAARVSLTKRGEVGDSRRSWTWAWRTALWSRLGQAERAHGCVAGLLAYNTLDNLWTTHPPFQIDGNLGIPAGMAEMFLQSHAGEIALLPALPKAYPKGSVKGLRARGEVIVDIEWKNGRLRQATLKSPIVQTVKVRVPGEKGLREIKLFPGKLATVVPR